MKNLAKLLTLVLIFTSVLALCTACKKKTQPPHEHTFEESWSYDGDYHFKKATCEHTDEVTDKNSHTYENFVCSVCGCQDESRGLSMSLNEDGQSYSCGRGSNTEADLVLPDTYKGKPITVVDGFGGDQTLKSITFGDYVETINSNTFYECKNLTTVTLPNSLITIGYGAFSGCSSLTGITIPDSVKTIDGAAFSGCYNLTTATIGSGVESIGSSAFSSCRTLKSIVIPNSVKTIDGSVFSSCHSLENAVIGNGVKELKLGVFSDCYSLMSVTIGSGVETIDKSAFNFCFRLVEIINKSPSITVEIHDDLNNPYGYLGYYAISVFNSGSNYVNSFTTDDGYVTYSNGNQKTLVNYVGNQTELTLPSDITEIRQASFYGLKDITNVVIGDNVKTIGRRVFEKCENLTNLTIGSKVSSIGFYAFEECEKLEKVYFGGTADAWAEIEFNVYQAGAILVTSNPLCYAEELYINDELVTDITITNATKIGKYAFFGYAGLKTVSLSNRVGIIYERAFYNCKNLESVTIGGSVGAIYNEVFSGCDKLTSITFSDNTSTWYRGTSSWNITNKKNGIETDLSSPTDNATIFKDTYKDAYWYKL